MNALAEAVALCDLVDDPQEGVGERERGPTLKAIGQSMGMGPSGVKFVEDRALRKLEGGLRRKGGQLDLGLGRGERVLDVETGLGAAILTLAVREAESADEEVKKLLEGARDKLWLALEEIRGEGAVPKSDGFEELRRVRDALVGQSSVAGRRALRLVSAAMTEVVMGEVMMRAKKTPGEGAGGGGPLEE